MYAYATTIATTVYNNKNENLCKVHLYSQEIQVNDLILIFSCTYYILLSKNDKEEKNTYILVDMYVHTST